MRTRTPVGHKNSAAKKTGLFVAASVSLTLAFSVYFPQVSYAVDLPDATLGKLENKFFQHTYPKDTETQRIDRIEKFVYGETRTGSDQQRLSGLAASVPSEGEAIPDQDGPAPRSSTASSNNNSSGSNPASTPAPRAASKPAPSAPEPPAQREDVSGTKYPAITAIENKILHQSYESQHIEDRLARLETKLFGKPSTQTDLIDRVDRLRQTTGVDVAARPGGSDWSEEDEDQNQIMPPQTADRGVTRGAAPGEDGMSFSGRNLRQDMNKAFGGMSTGGGGGSYGRSSSSMGGSWGTAPSGAYGFGNGGGGGGAAAPRRSATQGTAPQAVAGLGLTQQVSGLENAIFGKTYAKDRLPDRVSRLENSLYPNDKAAATKTLPDRVNRLVGTVDISKTMPSPAPRVAQRSKDPDFPDDDDMSIPTVAPQRLNQLLNQMNNMVNSGMVSSGGMVAPGSGFTGGYAAPAGNLATDPGTGLLIDRSNGNLIDPTTGMVIGKRVAPSPYVPAPMAPMYNNPGYRGGMMVPPFNNGFTPLGGGMAPSIGGTGMGMRGLGSWP